MHGEKLSINCILNRVFNTNNKLIVVITYIHCYNIPKYLPMKDDHRNLLIPSYHLYYAFCETPPYSRQNLGL